MTTVFDRISSAFTNAVGIVPTADKQKFLEDCRDNSFAAVQEKLAQFPDAVSWRDDCGLNGLHHAAANDGANVAGWLLDHGAPVDERTYAQNTPLHLAAFVGRKRMIELLLDKGAAVDAKNEDGKTPLARAIEGNNLDCAVLLVAHGATTGRRVKAALAKASGDFLAGFVEQVQQVRGNVSAAKILADCSDGVSEPVGTMKTLHFKKNTAPVA